MSCVIFLSHVLGENTPLYGGKGSVDIFKEKSIAAGDSCNTSTLTFSSHAGTHVDAPRHFLEYGRTLEQFSAENWVFNHPLIVDIDISNELIMEKNKLEGLISSIETDLVIFRTGFEKYRGEKKYWQENPGIVPEMAAFLKEKCPDIRAVGMDFISISSFRHRDIGRKAHQAFLTQDILIIEDMRLENIPKGKSLERVIALPLNFENADGAPITVIGFIG